MVALTLFSWWWPSEVGAHAELTSSDPVNASTLSDPVDAISFTFSKASEPDAERFTITGPAGPVGVESVTADESGRVLTLRPAEPLIGGRFRVGWAIRSGDTHKMTGAISFTVAAAPAGRTGVAAADADQAATPDSAPTNTAVTTVPSAPGSAATASSYADGASTDPLQPKDDSSATSVERVATVVRGGLYVGLLLAVGGTAYLSTVHRGARRETRGLVVLVQRSAAAVAVCSLVAVPVSAAVYEGGWGGVVTPSAWVDALSAGFGPATVLRLVGAALVAGFLGLTLVPAAGTSQRDIIRVDFTRPTTPTPGPAGSSTPGGAATLVAEAPAPATVVRRSRRHQTVKLAPSPLAWLGVAFLVASELFLGHTADTSPRLLVAVGDAVHLAAAGTWFAGVTLLAVTARRRRRDRTEESLAPLAARFSSLAALCVVAAAVTGVVMGGLILGDPAAVLGTAFGRVLVTKVLMVAVIAGIGAYHRRALLPRLSRPGGPAPDVLARFRVTLVVESVLFVVVAGLTAVLVAASPVP